MKVRSGKKSLVLKEGEWVVEAGADTAADLHFCCRRRWRSRLPVRPSLGLVRRLYATAEVIEATSKR